MNLPFARVSFVAVLFLFILPMARAVRGADSPPTIATSASASPNPVTSTSCNLNVLGADDGGEINLTYSWVVTNAPPASVVFTPNSTHTARQSKANFVSAGFYTLQVTISDALNQTVTSSVDVTVESVFTSITIAPSSAMVNMSESKQFSATAKNQFGMVLTSQRVFTWSVNGGGTVDASGLFTATSPGGPFTLTATSGPKSGVASVKVNAPPTFVTEASANPATGIVKSTKLTALGGDDAGEPALVYTWTSTGPAPVSFSPNKSNSSKNTTALFSKLGTYTLLVTIKDIGGLTATSTVTVTVDPVISSIVVLPLTAKVNLNSNLSLAAQGKDQFNGILATQPSFVWSTEGGNSISDTGLFTALTPGGPFNVTATSGGVRGIAKITVNAPPTVAIAASADPSSGIYKTSTVSVLGADDSGEAALRYTWAISGTAPRSVQFIPNGTNLAKTATVNFTRAGNYTFIVTIRDAGGLTVTSSVSVTVDQIFSSITVAPVLFFVLPNRDCQFQARARDQFNVPLLVQPVFSWSVNGGGTINATGLFSAGSESGGPFTVTAASGDKSGTATFYVNIPPVANIVNPVDGAVLPVPATFTLEADVTDEMGVAKVEFFSGSTKLGETTTVPYTWPLTNLPLGVYSYSVKATDNLGAMTTSSTVRVSVADIRILTSPASPVSPAWVEGETYDVTGSVGISIDGKKEFEAAHLGASRWYVDHNSPSKLGVPLSKNHLTQLEAVVRDNNGFTLKTLTQEIEWIPTDLAGKDSSTDEIIIRKGDSLLLTATGTGNNFRTPDIAL